MRRRLLVLTVLAAGAAACSGDDATVVAPSPSAVETSAAPSGEPVLLMGDNVFRPTELAVAAGTNVVVKNDGKRDHTWTSSAAGFDSGNLVPQGTFAVTFSTPGTFAFLCSYHDEMTGTITVT